MEKPSAKIIGIKTALPKYKYQQSELAKWMHLRHDPTDERLKRSLSVLYKKSKIINRYSVLPDFNPDAKSPLLFQNGKSEPRVEKRMEVYQKEALPLAKKSAEQSLADVPFPREEITHLIAVSCTGMSAPGLEVHLKSALKLKPEVACFAVNFIGCYATFPALKMAEAFCKADPEAKVLLVSVELCTIHFQNKVNENHLLSNALFADGAASCIVCSETAGRQAGFLIRQFHHTLLPSGSDDMAWDIHSDGFMMKLTSYIPDLVDQGIPKLLQKIEKESKINVSEIEHWAIHPGGNSILDKCKATLKLSEDALKPSYETMKEYGNLSAPTILFVLKNLLESSNSRNDQLCFALGFGPGLTLDGALLKLDGKNV